MKSPGLGILSLNLTHLWYEHKNGEKGKIYQRYGAKMKSIMGTRAKEKKTPNMGFRGYKNRDEKFQFIPNLPEYQNMLLVVSAIVWFTCHTLFVPKCTWECRGVHPHKREHLV